MRQSTFLLESTSLGLRGKGGAGSVYCRRGSYLLLRLATPSPCFYNRLWLLSCCCHSGRHIFQSGSQGPFLKLQFLGLAPSYSLGPFKEQPWVLQGHCWGQATGFLLSQTQGWKPHGSFWICIFTNIFIWTERAKWKPWKHYIHHLNVTIWAKPPGRLWKRWWN